MILFFSKRKRLDHIGILYVTVNHQHIIVFPFLHLLPSFVHHAHHNLHILPSNKPNFFTLFLFLFLSSSSYIPTNFQTYPKKKIKTYNLIYNLFFSKNHKYSKSHWCHSDSATPIAFFIPFHSDSTLDLKSEFINAPNQKTVTFKKILEKNGSAALKFQNPKFVCDSVIE